MVVRNVVVGVVGVGSLEYYGGGTDIGRGVSGVAGNSDWSGSGVVGDDVISGIMDGVGAEVTGGEMVALEKVITRAMFIFPFGETNK